MILVNNFTLDCVLMTEQLYNSIDFVLHWEKKHRTQREKGQKRSTDAFIKYKRPTESWLGDLLANGEQACK